MWSVIRDRRGVLYVGTQTGLLEYDGKNWRVVYERKRIDCRIEAMAIDEKGTVYVGMENNFGYLAPDSLGRMQYISLSDTRLGPDDLLIVTSVEVVGDTVFFGTVNAIYRYHQNTKRIDVVKPYAGLGNGSLFKIQDKLYANQVNPDNTWSILKGNQLVSAPGGEAFRPFSIISYAGLPSDTVAILATRSDGLLHYPLSPAGPPRRLPVSAHDFFQDNIIYRGASINDSLLMLASLAKGAALVDLKGHIQVPYSTQTLLADNSVLRIYPDRERNIWLCTMNGLSRVDLPDITYWDKHAGLGGYMYDTRRFNGYLYGVSSQGAVMLTPAGQVERVQGMRNPVSVGLTLFQYGQEQALLASHHQGLYRITGKEASLVAPSPVPLRANTLQQSVDKPERVYAAGMSGFHSFRFTGDKFMYEGAWKGIPVLVQSHNFSEDARGHLYIPARSRVLEVIPNPDHITQPTIRYIAVPDSLQPVLRTVAYRGDIIFDTGGGVMKLDVQRQRFVPYHTWGEQLTTVIELPRHSASNTAPDTALFRHIKQTVARRIPYSPLPGPIWIDDDGTWWLANGSGLYRYVASQDIKDYAASFDCLIRQVTVGADRTVYWGGYPRDVLAARAPYVLSYQDNRVTFDYAAPFFDQEEQTEYAVFLQGYDSSWSSWSTLATRQYNNLHEGHYTFHVRAKNRYGVISTVATYRFLVQPPWYRAWCAYLLYLVCLLALVGGVVKWRTRSLIADQKSLARLVDQRTQELRAREQDLVNSNQELRAALEHLKNTQEQLLQSQKMASLGHLTSGIAHEINNPLNYISGGVQALAMAQEELMDDIRRGVVYTQAELQERREDMTSLMASIHKGITRTATIVKRLLAFSEAGGTKTALTTVSLDECVQTAIMLLSNKLQGVQLEQSIATGIYVQGDLIALSQVFLNIMENALDAMENNTGERRLTIMVTANASWAVITIQDNGCGIAPEHYKAVMTPFFTTKEAGKGTGLGLSISYATLEQYQGKLTFTSALGVGTTFSVTLPVVSATPAEAHPQA